AHADDAAATNVDAGFAHSGKRVEPVLIAARGDDRAVVFRRGVEVVVVVVEPGGLQALRLRMVEHAERGAGFEAERAHALDHGADRVEFAILRLPPGCAHAEPARACVTGGLCLREYGLESHQFLSLEPGIVARALRTIGAILRTTTGLDREQC